jgi:hypothetical protein
MMALQRQEIQSGLYWVRKRGETRLFPISVGGLDDCYGIGSEDETDLEEMLKDYEFVLHIEQPSEGIA